MSKNHLPSDDYKLVWADEFDKENLDETKWSYRLLGPRGDATLVNDCVSIDKNKHLVLTTRRNNNRIETAMVGTEGKFEARIKFQTEPGHWSAFWLQSPTMAKVGSPEKNGTEIDIIEFFRTDPESMFMNIHWDGYGKDHKKVGSQHKEPNLKNGWHIVGLEWTANGYKFYLNGKEVWRTNEAVSRTKQYIILSLEVQKWSGNIADVNLPDSVIIDYVRVYQK